MGGLAGGDSARAVRKELELGGSRFIVVHKIAASAAPVEAATFPRRPRARPTVVPRCSGAGHSGCGEAAHSMREAPLRTPAISRKCCRLRCGRDQRNPVDQNCRMRLTQKSLFDWLSCVELSAQLIDRNKHTQLVGSRDRKEGGHVSPQYSSNLPGYSS